MPELIDSLPATIQDPPGGDINGQGRVLIRATTDLCGAGRLAATCLVVTESCVFLIPQNSAVLTARSEAPEQGLASRVPLSEIRSAKVDRVVGGGRLVLRDANGERGTVCFTNSVL